MVTKVTDKYLNHSAFHYGRLIRSIFVWPFYEIIPYQLSIADSLHILHAFSSYIALNTFFPSLSLLLIKELKSCHYFFVLVRVSENSLSACIIFKEPSLLFTTIVFDLS